MSNRKKILVLIFSALYIGAQAQITFQKTYGSSLDMEEGNSVLQTSDNGYIIVGTTPSFSNLNSIYLVKTDSNGDTLWTKAFGGVNLGYDVGLSIIQTSDSGYALTGYGQSFGMGNYEMFLTKTDMSGNILWTKVFGDGGIETTGGTSVKQ